MIRIVCALTIGVSLYLAGLSAQARVLDNFDDNTKTAWSDFTFVPSFGLPVEQDGQFKFEIPGPVLVQANQGLFSASQKLSETFELKEGRKIEFRVDVVKGGAKDSFAVLGFIPTANPPSSLAGYSLAKSTTDVLITKGINKYFVADDGPDAELKNENVTLVLSLHVRGGNVIVTAQVLDKDNANAVIWEKTVVDTPAADVFAAGTDSPAAPYIASGYFTLFCYADYDRNAVEDPYTVTYDNAEVYVTDMTILDDFNDNTKTAWTDFTFVPGFGLPVETNSEFKFEIPGPVLAQANQGLFSASQKVSREFALTEGERVEVSVDLVKGGAKDSFAVLGFLPTSNPPSSLAGYGLSKSTTDLLISKGINKYFVADDGPEAELKNENVTLDLSLTVKNGSIIIDAKVLDKDNNNAVLWRKTVVDTPAADVLAAGTDSPAAPYIASGYFTLFCYADYDRNAVEDPYSVTFDNAIVFAPPLATNSAPIISHVQPAEYSSFLPASTQISFQVNDDREVANDKIAINLNGTNYTSANGLQVTGSGTNKTATLGSLAADVNYVAILSAEDADGTPANRTLYFDTFAATNFVIEVEDYNFADGSFIDNPVVIAEESGPQPDAYNKQAGIQGVDYNETRTSPRAEDRYRPDDPVRMAHTRDNARARFVAAGGAEAGVFDLDVGDIAAGEWLNYTRTFPAGSYEIYLREALANMATGESVLEQVTNDPNQPDQTTRVLGSFLGTRTGFQYRNVPLTDGSGLNNVVLQLTGPTTLRLRQVTATPSDGSRFENYLIFIPIVGQAGAQRATIATLSPAAGSTVESTAPTISALILNRDTSVKPETIKLFLDNQSVNATITPQSDGASLTYKITPLPPSGTTLTSRLEFTDSENVTQTNEWTFTLLYNGLNPANRVSGTPGERGMQFRIVQAPLELGALDNSLARAEDQLAPNSTIPKYLDTNFVIQVVNFNVAGSDQGIPGDTIVPGLEPEINGTHDFATEMQTYLELSAGSHRFGVVTDDGFSVRSGTSVSDKTTTPLAFRSGGTADQTFEFFVPEAGMYPFRMVWYKRGGSAHAEWFSLDPTTGERILINDPDSTKAVKAFRSVSAPALVVESAADVSGPYAIDSTANINTTTQAITVPIAGRARFFRLNARGTSPSIVSANVASNTLTLTYITVD